MSLGKRITEIRKKINLSQSELGKRIGTSGDIIGRYERDEVKPSIEVASNIADVLDVSLDYLMGKTELKLDKAIFKRIVDIQQLPEIDKGHILYTIDGLLRDAKTRQSYAS